MTDNRIEVSSVSDSRIARYSSDSIQKSLSLAKKLSNPDCEQEEGTKYSDLIKLVETAQKDLDINAAKISEKMLEGKFDFNDFLRQMQMLKKMGSLGGLLDAIPELNNLLSDAQLKQGENALEKAEIIIYSMTEDERADPDLLAGSVSRQQRVAEDSGYSESDIRKFIAEFTRMRRMMQQMSTGNFHDVGTGAKSERDAKYYFNSGTEKYNSEDNQAAVDDLTKAINLDPDYAIAYYWRAAAKYNLGNYQAAIDDFTYSIKLDPNNSDAYQWRDIALNMK